MAATIHTSIRSLLQSLTSLPSHSPTSHKTHNLPPTLSSAFETKSLHLKSSIRTICSSVHHPLYSSFSATAPTYNKPNDEYQREPEEQEEVDQEEEVEEEEHEQLLPTSYEQNGRLYVGNLPYTMTANQLSDIFKEAGTVDSVKIIYDRVTNRSRGFSFVTMSSVADAKEAIRMFNGSQMGGRTVKVNFPEVPIGGEREVLGPWTSSRSRGYVDSPYKVYAGNLGWTVTSESLKHAFAEQSGLLGAKVIYEHGTRRSRGFGFVTFSSLEDARAAIEAVNGKEVAGRPLRLNLASERSSTAGAASLESSVT